MSKRRIHRDPRWASPLSLPGDDAGLWLPPHLRRERRIPPTGRRFWYPCEDCCGAVACTIFDYSPCYNGTPLTNCVATVAGVAADSCGAGCVALNGEYTVSSQPLPASQYWWTSPLSVPCPDPLASTEIATLSVSVTCDFLSLICVLRAAIGIYRGYASGHPDDPAVGAVKEIHTFEKWPTAIIEPGSVHTIPYRSWQGWCSDPPPPWSHCGLVPRQCDASIATVTMDFSAP